MTAGNQPDPTLNVPLARTVLLAVSPVSVAAAMLVAWVGLVGWGASGHGRELLAAGAVNAVAGVLAALPTVILLRRGGSPAAMGALAATGIRLFITLGGVLLLLGPGWALARNWLLGFAVVFYLVVLALESTVVAWVLKREP